MPLDPGWAAVVGAAVGTIGTLSAACLTHHLSTKRTNSLAEKRRKRLRALLEDVRWTWRSLETLSSAAGAESDTTIGLLIEIDARADMKDPTKWALVSRAPWPAPQETDSSGLQIT